MIMMEEERELSLAAENHKTAEFVATCYKFAYIGNYVK